MKYFNELDSVQQTAVLDALQPLPLFTMYRNAARELLLSNTTYMFDDKLNLHINLNIKEE